MGDKRAVDVLIVGSGGAGLRAAIEAAGAGCATAVISKGKVNRSGASLLAGANISADVECDGNSLYKMGFPGADRDDSKDAWFREIVDQGMFLNDQRLVETYVEDAADRVRELIDWGLRVNGLESGRGISVSSRRLLDVLMRKAVERGVECVSDLQAVDLLVKDGRACGVLGVDVFTGEYVEYRARAIILATGGWHSLYPLTSGGTDLTGDGQGMAFRAGADLINMEMVTFCPNTVLSPGIHRGSIAPYILGGMGYGHLLNRKGEEFLQRYFDPGIADLALHTEWNKLMLSFAEAKEIEKEGTPVGGLYFSMKHCPNEVFEEILETIPGLRESYLPMIERLASGYSIEIAPAAEYFEGGIRVNERYETAVAGLYAAGECAGGLFGANRVSAATTQMLVQGCRAAGCASEYAMETGPEEVDRDQVSELKAALDLPFERQRAVFTGAPDPASPAAIRKRVGELADRYMSVIRTGEGIEHVESEVGRIRNVLRSDVALSNRSRAYNPEWLEYLALRNLVDVLDASSKSAGIRTESRGAHFREDHQYTDNDEWVKCIVTTKGEAGSAETRFEPVVAGRVQPPPGRADYWENILGLARKYI